MAAAATRQPRWGQHPPQWEGGGRAREGGGAGGAVRTALPRGRGGHRRDRPRDSGVAPHQPMRLCRYNAYDNFPIPPPKHPPPSRERLPQGTARVSNEAWHRLRGSQRGADPRCTQTEEKRTADRESGGGRWHTGRGQSRPTRGAVGRAPAPRRRRSVGECALPHPPRAARPLALPLQGEGKKRHADCAGWLDAMEGSGGGEEGRSWTDTSTCRLSAWIKYDTQCRPPSKLK